MPQPSTSRKRPRSPSFLSDGAATDTGPSGEPTETSTSGTPQASQDADDALQSTKTKKSRFEKRYKVHEHSNEEILEIQRERWKSSVYAHFQTPEVIEINGEIKYKFICKAHPTTTPIIRARHDDSTSNLKRHVDACDGKVVTGAASIEDFAHGGRYNVGTFRFLLVMWIVRRYRPFLIVEDEELRRLLRMLYARVEIPSAVTISRDVQEIFNVTLKNVAKRLQNHKGRLHLCMDGWTSPNVVLFLGVTVQGVEGGKIFSIILDYIRLTKAHRGTYLASELTKTLKVFGIETKLESLGGMNSKATQIRCLGHIINLVVKAIISPFMCEAKNSEAEMDDNSVAVELEAQADDDADVDADADADDDDNNGDLDEADSENELDADREESDQQTIDSIIASLRAEDALTADDKRVGHAAVNKIVAFSKRSFWSPTICNDFRAMCATCNIRPLQMKRAVSTRWNSLSVCASRALELRPAIDKLLSLSKYDIAGKDGLRRYKLTPEEWTLLEQLEPLLKIFLEATERISRSKIPLLFEVIPIIDVLTSELDNVIANEDLHRMVRIAATRGRTVINKYYSKTDDSIMYRVAMLLHPGYKREYFQRAEWADDWIATAVKIACDHWIQYYKPAAMEPSQSTGSGVPKRTGSAFAVLDNWNKRAGTVDAFDTYIDSPCIASCTDPIAYWESQAAGGNDALARMALDFLSAPATSVDVECAFSRGGLTVSKRRHGLKHDSIRAATVLSSWAEMEGLIPEKEITQLLKDKLSRSKANMGSSSKSVVVLDSDSD